MNKKKYGFVACLLLLVTVVSLGATNIYVNHKENTESEEQLHVVTSFYPMYIATMNVVDGCDSVVLENLSEPQTGCLHDYQLTPEDMVLLSKADVFIVNGGGIESFLSEIAVRYPHLTIIEAGADAEMLGENAHMWMDMENYQKQVKTIAGGLAEARLKQSDSHGHTHSHTHSGEDSSEEEERTKEMKSLEEDASLFENNAEVYCEKIQQLADNYQEIRKYAGEKVVLFHEAYEYVTEEWGLENVYTLNLDEERQVSAGEVADVVKAVQNDGVNLILAEQLYGEETAKTIQGETEAEVLYLDTCVRGEYEKDAYLSAMKQNLELLQKALGTQQKGR